MKVLLSLTAVSAVGAFTWSIGQKMTTEAIYILVGALFFGGLVLPILLLVFSFLSEQATQNRLHLQEMARINATRTPSATFNILSLHGAGEQQRTLGASLTHPTLTVEGKVNRPALTANRRPQAHQR